jgi:hypothetical protein
MFFDFGESLSVALDGHHDGRQLIVVPHIHSASFCLRLSTFFDVPAIYPRHLPLLFIVSANIFVYTMYL